MKFSFLSCILDRGVIADKLWIWPRLVETEFSTRRAHRTQASSKNFFNSSMFDEALTLEDQVLVRNQRKKY